MAFFFVLFVHFYDSDQSPPCKQVLRLPFRQYFICLSSCVLIVSSDLRSDLPSPSRHIHRHQSLTHIFLLELFLYMPESLYSRFLLFPAPFFHFPAPFFHFPAPFFHFRYPPPPLAISNSSIHYSINLCHL